MGKSYFDNQRIFTLEQEKKVLGNSKKEENIYIGVGAVVLLVGVIILVKK
jgi:hypothetical protein